MLGVHRFGLEEGISSSAGDVKSESSILHLLDMAADVKSFVTLRRLVFDTVLLVVVQSSPSCLKVITAEDEQQNKKTALMQLR